MSRKIIVILSALAIGAALMAATAAAHGDMPDVLIIDKVKAKKAPVPFPHKDHQALTECVTCHHNAEKGKEPQSCFNCHGKDPNAPDPTVSNPKENPFHIRCRGCHKEQAKGPTKCNECHKG